MRRKRIVSLLLSLTVLLGTIAIFAAEGEKPAPSGEEGQSMPDRYVSLMQALEIMEPSVDSGASITRGAFAQIACGLYGLEEIPQSTSGFEDVPADSPYQKYIAFGVEQGLFSGQSESVFGIDEPLLMEEAVKVLMNAAGYADLARIQGGYPQGYLITARRSGLLDSVGAQEQNPVTYAQLARMIDNLFGIGIVDFYGYSEDGNNLYHTTQKTILSEYLHLSAGTGTVTGVKSSTLTGDQDLKKGRVTIDGEIFDGSAVELDALLGYRVDYFYDNTDKLGEKRLAAVLARDANELTLDAEDLVSAADDNGVSLEYYQDGRVKKLRIPSDAYVMYNGIAYNALQAADCELDFGSIRLLDNDQNGTYDVVFIESVVTFVVDGVDRNEFKIRGKYGNELLSVDPDENDVSYYKADVEVSLEDVSIGDVASAVVSKNKLGTRCIRIQLSSTSVGGRLSAVKDNGEVLSVDGVDYPCRLLDPEKSVKSDGQPDSKVTVLEAGNSYLFQLDSYGRIVDFKSIDGVTTQIGFIINYAKSGTAFETQYQFKLFNVDGSTSILSLAEKYKIDGIRQKDDVDPGDILRGVSAENAGSYTGAHAALDGIQQVIKYTVNGNGEITNLDTIRRQSGEDEEATLKLESKGSRRYKIVDKAFYGDDLSFGVGDAKILAVPGVPDNGNPLSLDENDFTTYTVGKFENDGYYDMEVYNFSDVMIPELMVMYGQSSGSSITADEPFMLVDSVVESLSDDGVSTLGVTGVQSGAEKTVVISPDAEAPSVKYEEGSKTYVRTDFKNIEKGDLVKFAYNKQREAVSYMKAFSLRNADNNADNNDNETILIPDLNENVKKYGYNGKDDMMIYGYVSAIKDKNMVVNYTDASGKEIKRYVTTEYVSRFGGGIYRYDTVLNTCSVIPESQLLANENPDFASKVVVYSRYDETRTLVLIE